jgi:hypothetical protein
MKRNVKKVWGAHYTLGALYLLKNTVTVVIFTLIFNFLISLVLELLINFCQIFISVQVSHIAKSKIKRIITSWAKLSYVHIYLYCSLNATVA